MTSERVSDEMPVAFLGTNLDGESEPFLTERQAEFWSNGACKAEPLFLRTRKPPLHVAKNATTAASPPRAVIITDEMVERAITAFKANREGHDQWAGRRSMRAAITAALTSEAHNG